MNRIELWNLLSKAELVSTKSGVHDKTIIDPPMKGNSNKDGVKTAEGPNVKSKAIKVLTCRQSGKSVQKVSKKRLKATGGTLELEQCVDMKSVRLSPNQGTMLASDSNSGCLRLPSTPMLHPKSPVMTSSTQNSCQKILMPVSVQCPPQIQKFQLQLFPVDESTRKFLEEENHCPYLELTITTKKKIASVIRHLNIKWGNSRTASEELILFPYNARVESLENSKRWSLKDSYITAAEVHAAIGKPAVFRLRYGWIKINKFPQTSLISAHQSSSQKVSKKVVDRGKQINSTESHECEPFPSEFLLKQSISETSPMNSIQSAENLRSENNAKISWDDGVSNMSFGALLSEVEATESAQVCLPALHHQIPVSCDSFDSAIAAHIARYQPAHQPTTMAQPSILDAEETCNPFSFHSFKNIRLQSDNSSCQTVEQHKVKLYRTLSPLLEHAQDDGHLRPNATLTSGDDVRLIEEEEAQRAVDSQAYSQVENEEMPVDRNATSTATNQFEGVDMHWPPSAGPWQFGVSPQQMINGDSNGLSGFVSTSMDIF